MVTQTRRRPDAGLTLVELMVTIVVASLVTTSTFAFFAGQRRIYDTQRQILGMQQNLWAAMDVISRDVRLAGMGMAGCVNTTVVPLDPGPTGAAAPQLGLRAYRPLAAGNCQVGGAICNMFTPCSNICSNNPLLLCTVDTDCVNPGTCTGLNTCNMPGNMVRMAPLWIRNGAGGSPDAVTVAYGMGILGNFADADLTLAVPTATSPVRILPGEGTKFRDGDFISLIERANPSLQFPGCTVFQLTGAPVAGDILPTATTSTWNPTGNPVDFMRPGGYTAAGTPTANGVSIGGGVRNLGTSIAWTSYFLQGSALMVDNLTDPNPAEVLAEGVVDMQIAFACDFLPAGPPIGDGVLTENLPTRSTDEWLLNDPADNLGVAPFSECIQPKAVRITLVVRSMEPDESLKDNIDNQQPRAEDTPAGPAPTQGRLFRYRVMTTTVFPRNN